MTRWVVFDYGNVLSEPHTGLDALAGVLDAPADRFEEVYWSFRLAYDHGMSDLEYWRSVGRALDVEVSEGLAAELNRADFAVWLRASRPAVALVAELAAAGVPLALLSNAPSSLGRALAEQSWTRHFDHLVFSGDLGVAKPAPEVWASVAELLGSSDCVFFDDRPENVTGAVEAGWTGVEWRGADHARAELARLGLL
ncbi:HAD-IA family hydrolase [Saccharothrix sp. NPDC042600]|uniref:HAD-IA family hydrolase n=1 Tax=Saccharothrix TaxID=2071 RepID=UPI0033C22A53|nr:HAD family phosphatase [Saccharothrix mutabilis subsp. capreolus]